MICKTENEYINDFQELLGDNGRATLAYQWALRVFGNDINDGFDFIKSIINNIPSTKSAAKNLLSLMESKKLLYRRKTRGGEHYITNYPDIVKQLLANKRSTIIFEEMNIGEDAYEKPRLTIFERKKPLSMDEVFAANFDNSVQKDINRIGEGMLGTSLMSLDGVVKTELVNQTVDTIVEKIARKVISGNDLTRADVDSIINGYYDAFVDYHEKAEASGNQKAIEHIESYLDENNWENLRNMIYTALKNRSGIIFTNGVKSKDVNDSKIQDEDAIKDNNEDIDVEGGDKAQGNYADNFAITLDNKVGLSGKLKLFMSTLKNDRKHYLTGEPLFENFDTAYNTLNAILAGEEPNIYGMIAKLKEYKDYGWINDLINKLEEANHKDSGNQDLVKQFVTAMNKHYINMSFIQWENTPTGHELRIMNDNANSRQRTVTNDWVTALNKTNLVYTNTEFKKLLDEDEAKLALEKLNALGNKELFDLKPNDITDFFKTIGINLSPRSAKAIIDGKFELRGKKISVEDFFNVKKSTSPLKHIGDILKRIIASQEPIEVGSKDVDFFRQGTVKALADLEAKHTRHLYSNSHKSGTKTVFSYTNDKFIVDRLYELVRGFKTGNKDNYKLLEELSTDIFAENSYWLSELKQAMEDGDTTFIENFTFGYMSLDPLKKKNDESSNRSMADRTAKEILAIKLAHFLNKGERIGRDKRRVINMLYPTTSDKTIGITIQSLIPQIDGGINYLNGSINDGTVDFIYEKIVKSEMNRMWAIQKQTKNYSLSTDIDGYDDGAKYFYTIPALNGIKGLFDFDTAPGKRLLKPENEIEPEAEVLVRSTIKRSLNLMIATQIDEFKTNDIGFVEGEDNLQYMDTDGVADLAADYGNINLKEKSDAVAASFAINYFIHNANVAQLFHGDYAQYFKNNDIAEDFEKMIENDNVTNMALLHAMIKPTFDNLGKRLAADVAPGYEADWGDKTQLLVTVSNDRKMKSLAMEYIELIYQKNVEGLLPHDTAEKKAALKAYNKINSSDAQSYSSLEFHIKTLFNFGNKNITEKEYNHLIDKINKAKVKSEDVHFEADELALVLQPTKPIYSNNSQQRNNDGSTIGVRKYIKTSTFPLIPQLVKGSELEAVMRAMDKGNVDMHVYESGFKVGMNSTHINEDKGEAQSGKLSLFNKDGSMNFEEVDKLSLSKNIMALDIKGFKIQQEVPYHDHPGDVNKGTQESKLLFSNIRKILGFNYNGKKYSGAQLEEMYNKAYKKLYADAARNLRKELYIDGKLNIEKIQQLFLEEANSRNYSINDKLGLALNEKKDAFEFPLWALPAAHQYESMLISIVDNRVRKLKIPGNSFVLGSEAGFNFKNQVKSGKEGKAIVSKYQDQIIFTSNFNNESLLHYRPDGEFMKPTQVFVPMKLKGSNGEFIDLMKYTYRKDGKLFLDESRLPKDLLKMFGFRIPTQGHNSMAALEIAGFLPAACGDLIIASQDLVVQMGSDFDVDKLYTYMYSTKEILRDKGQFKRIKEIKSRLKELNSLLEDDSNEEDYSSKEKMQEFINSLAPVLDEEISLKRELQNLNNQLDILRQNSANFKIVRDNKKSLYNDLLDIHLAVFDNNNPELYKLILSPNGFGQLKTGNGGGLAKDIDAIKTRTGRPDYNFLSAQYQMMKFFNGISGKSGTGVFSSTSMFHAICQDKGLRYVDTTVVEGVMSDNFDMEFGTYVDKDGKVKPLKSTGKIGEIKTLDETGYVSKVIEAFQSASVDNEKEQILYKLNINKHTFATINALALLGFNEATICYFINQPVIEEYVKRMSDKESSLNKFDENQVGDIFELIAKEFKDKYAIEENKKARNYGVDELKAMLEVDSNQRDSAFWSKQLAILSKFKDTNKIGNNLQSVMQTVNAESKGLGKTVFGSLDRQDKIDNIDEVTLNYGKKSATGLLGAEKILYEVDDKGEIAEEKGVRKSNSMNGFVAEFGTSELNKIGRTLLPYDNNIIKGLFKYFGGILQRRGESISKNEEFMSETFSAIKSFIFSNKKLFGEDFDIKTERKRLFVGSYKEVGDGRLEVDVPSLPDIIDGIKATPLGESNALLRSLIPDLSMRTSRVKLIKYTASAGQNLDESELHQAFIALFRENIDIPYALNGIEMTKNSRELAMDLIKYVYLSGGTQEAIQFTRYIPIDVLNYMGFSDVLKGVAGKFTASTFGIEMKENNIVSSNVTEQILQHNPKKVPVKVKGMLTPNSKENLKSGIKNVKSTKRLDGVEIITEFELVLDAKNSKLSTGEYMVNQPYISGKFDKSRDWVIYKFNGKSYQLIPTLGTFGVSEYDFNLAPGQIAESIIPGRNLKHVDNSIPVEVKDKGSEVIDDSKFNIEKTYNLFANVNDDNQIESVLNLVKDSNNLDPYHKELAESLLQNTHLLATLSKIKIHYSSDLNDAGLFTPYESSDENTYGRIDISNNKQIHPNKSSLDRAILHEINHAYTVRVLRDYEFGRRDLPQNVINAIQKIDILRRSLKYKLKQNDALRESFERVEKFLNPKTHSTTRLSPEDMITYGLASNVEFVTMAMENPKFRNAIDGLSREFPNETPFLTRLWNALLELIGLQNTSQITKDYVTREIFQFINEIDRSLDKTIEKPQVIEGFSNSQKYKDVEKALEDLANIKQKSDDELYGEAMDSLGPLGPQITIHAEDSESTLTENSFTYRGVTIPTDFKLTNGQVIALERLIDFIEDGKTDEVDNLITLQGYAGTGKTTIIGYLQKYFGNKSTFIYMAPTHAATVELSMATSKTGNKSLAMTVASGFREIRDFATGTSKKVPSKKLEDRLGYMRNILIVDEVSMLNKNDYNTVKEAIKSKDIKVIFMGDMMQIPEVDASNPKQKQVSLAFSELEQVELTEVKRTSDVGILNVLTAIRKGSTDKIPVVPNTNTIQYITSSEFDKKIYETFREDPENTTLISYTNAGAKAHNKRIRQSLGRTGNLVENDIIVGFGGYNSKQIEAGNIANSIRYTVTKVKKSKNDQYSAMEVEANSSRLEKLRAAGVNVSSIGRMSYLQLSDSDSFIFDEISREELDLNNKFLSDKFDRLLDAKNKALTDKRMWPMYFAVADEISKTMAKFNLGNDYIYNPKTKSMELFEYNSHKDIVKKYPELKVEKGVDYGHAITIHKSQGSTVSNVFFDSNTLPKGSSSTLMQGNKPVGSEKKSLIYVALSRASNKLYINKVDGNLFYGLSKGEPKANEVGGEFDFIDPGVDIDKDNFAGGTVEWALSPSFQEDIDLSLTREEIKMLEAKHGKNALSDYNQLTDKEKEYIIKCLG